MMQIWRHIINSNSSSKTFSIAKKIVLGFILVALLHPFLANDVPLIAKNEQGIKFPVFQKISNEAVVSTSKYQWKINPPIPYSAMSLDLKNGNYKSPFEKQNVDRWSARHWLGTDQLGRDTFAGLIHGTWIALLIGLFSALFSVVIGVVIGSLSGYFGNDKIKLNIVQCILIFISATLLIYQISYGYVFGSPIDFLLEFLMLSITIALLLTLMKLTNYLKLPVFSFPFDALVVRILEIFKSIPNLFLILAFLVIFKNPSIWNIILILAIIYWPISCRYTRAEVMSVRSEDFIKSAESLGLPNSKTLFRHILPNAIGPAMITFAFTVSSAIVAEAVLSFLGFGLSVEQVTWGSMLSQVRDNLNAWWLVCFPGFLLFLIVVSFNTIANHLAVKIKN